MKNYKVKTTVLKGFNDSKDNFKTYEKMNQLHLNVQDTKNYYQKVLLLREKF